VTKKIYVGNLSFNATEAEVREMFEEYGEVHSVAMINDRDTGRFRGFCFVEMDDQAAEAAIEAMDGTEVGGRALRVNEAREREERGRGGPRSGGRPSGGRGGDRGGFKRGGDRGGDRGSRDRGSRGGRDRDNW
jgi:RNA recognition motif-containing protein